MNPTPFDLEPQLRQHAGSLRRLAFELTRDPAAVDDALQDTWLQALRHPPHREAQAQGWLATVLRHVVFRARREERRRIGREQAVAREPLAGDPADTAARAEVAERLLAAVRGLDQPFRDTVWQRYFEDLPPREIAVCSGVPVATVKSRLQRGLQQLRERLGEEGESDWRGALVLAFGLDVPKGAAGVATVAAVTGGVLMATWTKVVAGAAVAAIVAWSWWPTTAPPAAPGGNAGGSATIAAQANVERTSTGEVRSDQHMAATDRRMVAADTQPALTATSATLRGRCVDDDGQPLAGCTVRLGGSFWNSTRRDAWLLDHPEPERLALTRTTEADGRFVFTFEPPLPFGFTFQVAAEGRVGLVGQWSSIEGGALVDIGDVVLQSGVLLTGQLVDEDGNPHLAAELSTMLRDDGGTFERDGALLAWDGNSAKTDASGRFTFRSKHAPGAYHVSLGGSNGFRRIGEVELPPGQPVVDVRLVARIRAPRPTISGRVVDDTGQPVARALVRPDSTALFRLHQWSEKDGRFTLEAATPIAEPIVIAGECTGYETSRTATAIPWGTTDLELVLHAAPTLHIRVTDAQCLPVADYAVRVIPRDRLLWMEDAFDVRARGPFEDGAATIPVPSGKWTVVVEFPSSADQLASFTPIEVTGAALRLDLRAERPVERMLRVVDPEGRPVVGTHVQVCDLVDGEFDGLTWVRKMEHQFSAKGMKRAIVCHEAQTDANGSCVVRGPGSREVGLFVHGPGHVPLRQRGVHLDGADALEVTVQRGARLQGRIVPREAWTELQRLIGDSTPATMPAHMKPAISIRRDVDGQTQQLPKAIDRDASFDITADGAFGIEDLPPGDWHVLVRFWHTHSDGSRSTMLVDAGEVVLREGMTSSLEADLSSILPGTLEATVTHNGGPLRNTDVRVRCTYAAVEAGETASDSVIVRTDERGHFTHVGRPGDYGVAIAHGERIDGWTLPAAASATVVRDRTTRHTFAIWSGIVKARLLDHTGAPAAGVTLFANTGGAQGSFELPPCDAAGLVEFELPIGPTELLVLPKRLQSRDARQRSWAAHAKAGGTGDPVAATRIPVTTVTITADQPTEVQLRLSPSWDR